MLKGLKNVVGGGKSTGSKDAKETPTTVRNPSSESKSPEISSTKTTAIGDKDIGFHGTKTNDDYTPSDPIAAAEIMKLRNEMKRLKEELFQQQSAPVKKQSAPSGSIEEADAKLY